MEAEAGDESGRGSRCGRFFIIVEDKISYVEADVKNYQKLDVEALYVEMEA